MLSNEVARKINRQIENEMRDLNSTFTSNEDKLAIIDRISKLKQLLEPQPSRSDILDELATAIVEAQRKPKTTNPAHDLVAELFAAFRR